ncbi:MAG: hypothetical protein ABL993_04600 [Vicinamibacterales bacterium]
MGDNTGPKSAYELAMERLRKQDKAAGVERQVVTEAQKAAVAEVRSVYDAKLAQIEVIHQGQMAATFDRNERAVLEEGYRRDRERITSERDAKVAKARGAHPG